MRKISLATILLLFAACLVAQTEFDIRAFSDSTKYGWSDWRQRNSYRDDLLNRQDLLQMYEMRSRPIENNILRSALIPGLGQLSCKAGTKGSIILGAELLSLGASLYFYDRSLYYYEKYLTATQIDDIEAYYKAAMNPRQYSWLFLALGAVVWGYNIYDVILTTDEYNAQIWQEILENNASQPISIGPDGIRVTF